MKNGIPIALGYLSVSFSFGAIAVSMGFSVIQAVLISLLNLTSAGQFASLEIIAGQGTYLEMAIVELPDKSTLNIANMAFLSQRKVYGSLIGGIKETQEMLDYSVAHGIYPEVEIIKADAAEIDKAWRNVSDGKVKFRYVIDMNTLRK